MNPSEILEKYVSGKITPEEKFAFKQWLETISDEEYHQLLLMHEEVMIGSEVTRPYRPAMMEAIQQRIAEAETGSPAIQMVDRRTRYTIGYWVAAAAMVVLIAGWGVYYYAFNKIIEKPIIASMPNKGDVQPGHDGAVLHLSNGSTVVLDSAQNGTVATQGAIRVVKLNGGVKYEGRADKVDGVVYNDITTDRGRQWQLTLPDGTKVWLNAASSIHYPLTFTGHERVVEITGEAYFEVAHNPQQPFRVKAGNQVIEDVGTAFNVNAYEDEPSTETTLLEGSIKVKGLSLKPGQQVSTNRQGEVSLVKNVNIDQVVAWKNGAFSFTEADLYTVLRQLARWYNVEVIYRGPVTTRRFSGEIGRSLSLSQVLRILTRTHIHYQINDGTKLIILP